MAIESVPVETAFEIALPATRERLAAVRAAIEPLIEPELARCGCTAQFEELMLALQEAMSNVVRHAYSDRTEPGPLYVRVERMPHLLRVTVADEGVGYDPAAVPPPDFEHPREGGFGLHLMQQVMSKVAYSRRDGRNTLLMEKVLAPLPVESAA